MRSMPVFIFLVCFISPAFAQKEAALDYLTKISEEYEHVVRAQWDYAVAVAGNKGQGKSQKDLETAIDHAIAGIRSIAPYNKDESLRDSVVAFLEMNQHIISEDYRKVSDMTSLEEHSYDEMQAFLYDQEKNYSRLSKLAGSLKTEEEKFARKHGIHLVKREDKFSRKFEHLNRLFSYYNKIYLIFFKVYRQELILYKKIEQRSPDSISLHINFLETYSSNAVRELNHTGIFDGDDALRKAALGSMHFYEEESSRELQPVLIYYQQVEQLDSLKRARQNGAKNADEYNTLARELNKKAADLNSINETLNDQRALHLNNWNEVSSEFLSEHIR